MKMNRDEVKKAKKILSRIMYATIATVSKEGKPWNTPLFIALDEKYNFYWGSAHDSQHSKNIRNKKEVFLTVYDSTAPADTGEGVYIEAIAEELEDLDDIQHAHSVLQTRRPTPYWRLEQFYDDTPLRLYKAEPKKI